MRIRVILVAGASHLDGEIEVAALIFLILFIGLIYFVFRNLGD